MSKIYQTIKIESLSQLVPFFEFSVVEKISVDAVKNSFVAMKVDHMKGVVIFGNLVSFCWCFSLTLLISFPSFGDISQLLTLW